MAKTQRVKSNRLHPRQLQTVRSRGCGAAAARHYHGCRQSARARRRSVADLRQGNGKLRMLVGNNSRWVRRRAGEVQMKGQKEKSRPKTAL
jgi:hypothetical protein